MPTNRSDPSRRCWRKATIEKLAVNAVMAGCKPDYFPVVLTALDALLDNDCQLYGIQTATNTTAPLLIVNGPMSVRSVSMPGATCSARASGQCRDRSRGESGPAQYRRRHLARPTWRRTAMPASLQLLHRRGRSRQPVGAAPCRSWSGRRRQRRDRDRRSSPQNVFTYGCETGEDILEHFVGAVTGLGHNNIIFPTGPVVRPQPGACRDHWRATASARPNFATPCSRARASLCRVSRSAA